MVFVRILFFVFLNSFSLNSLSNDTSDPYKVRTILSEEIFQSIKQISSLIRNECLAPECIVIGLGRSPAPITAFLEVVDPESTIDLPLSSFKYASTPQQASSLQLKALSEVDQTKLFNYFDSMIIKKLNASTSKILLIDFATTGQSLYSAQSFLEKYFNKINMRMDVSSIGFGSHKESQRVRSVANAFSLKKTKYIGLKENSALFERFIKEDFEQFAHFEKFDLFKTEGEYPNPKENRKPIKLEFQKYLQQRIQTPQKALKEYCRIIYSHIFKK